MRAYFFGNMYLSSIQQGIQAQHATTRMFVKYEADSFRREMLLQYGRHYETSILVNAGYSSEIRKVIEVFQDPSNPYPWSEFYESKEALDGALTTVGIVIPEHVYDTDCWVGKHRNEFSGPIEGNDIFDYHFTDFVEIGHLGDSSECTIISPWEFAYADMARHYQLAR